MCGPTKEFFHTAISCLSTVDPCYKIQLFCGEPGHLVPFCEVDALATGCFKMIGKLLAHIILHGGCGFLGMAPALVNYLKSGSVEESRTLVTATDLPDIELRTLLEEKVCLKLLLYFLYFQNCLALKLFLMLHACLKIDYLLYFNFRQLVRHLWMLYLMKKRVKSRMPW